MAIYERLCSAVSSLGTRAHIVNSDADASSVNTDNCILVIVCAWSAPSWMVLNLIVHILALPGNDDTDLYVMDCEKWNSLDIWREIGEEGEYMGVPQSPGWGSLPAFVTAKLSEKESGTIQLKASRVLIEKC